MKAATVGRWTIETDRTGTGSSCGVMETTTTDLEIPPPVQKSPGVKNGLRLEKNKSPSKKLENWKKKKIDPRAKRGDFFFGYFQFIRDFRYKIEKKKHKNKSPREARGKF